MPENQTLSKPSRAEQGRGEGLSSSVLFSAGCCPECGSRELTWHADTKNYGGVVDGRICMREVGPIFYLGCDECSETIRVIDGGKVAAMLTEMQAENPKRWEAKPSHPRFVLCRTSLNLPNE
jgi:hypothetical protein